MAKNKGIPLAPREEVQDAGRLKQCLVHISISTLLVFVSVYFWPDVLLNFCT
jgi:hypothetical protein